MSLAFPSFRGRTALARPIPAGVGSRLAVGATAAAVALLPFLEPSGPGHISPVDVLVATSIGACLLWAGSARAELRLPYALSGGLFLLAGAVAGLVGSYPGQSLLSLAQEIPLLLWCAAITNLARLPDALATILRTWAYSALVWAAVLIAGVAVGNATVAGLTEETGPRAALTLGNPNLAVTYFFLSVFIVWAAQRPRRRLLRWGGYALLITAMMLTGSNGGIVALGAGTVVAGTLAIRRRHGIPAAVAVTALAAVSGVLVLSSIDVAAVQGWARRSGTQWLVESFGHAENSVQSREELLNQSARLYYEGGLLGQGPASTESRLVANLSSIQHEAHDDYTAALIERGVPGAVALLLLLGSVGIRTWSIGTRPLRRDFAVAVPRPLGLVGGVVGSLVSGLAYEFLHFRHVWALLGVIAALYLWGRE